MTKICESCKALLEPVEEHRHLSTVLCEACYLEKRMQRRRKTHWQYIKSVKDEYLKPGKSK